MNATAAVESPVVDPKSLPLVERYRLFGEELDGVKEKVLARVGADDVKHVRRLHRFSRVMEVIGRGLIHFSFEPVGFLLGVGSLWVHKQLQATEIGHTALHGAYDRLEGAEAFHSLKYSWDTPIDEESWRYGHNVRHHGSTNVVGKDPDIHFGPVRLTKDTPYNWRHRFQLPFALFVLFPWFGFFMNMHFTGLTDLYLGNGRGGMDFLKDRSAKTQLEVWKKALRKYVPYYFKNYVFFPALAGPFFWKVLLGNLMAEIMRDVYSAATIYCGHVGEEVRSYAEETKPLNRGHWYAMQVEASNNFEVSRPVSILCGGLDFQIEHHLFPALAPERLREIGPEVQAICERYGVVYRKESWGKTLVKALKHIQQLSQKEGVMGLVREMA